MVDSAAPRLELSYGIDFSKWRHPINITKGENYSNARLPREADMVLMIGAGDIRSQRMALRHH